jgi:pimeloyl-ACP methyl ester carboxylesterase/DNA-binding CsgD family transcriptional regulator
MARMRGAPTTPDVSYARTHDGLSIAYTTVGDGPVTVVFAPGLLSQVEIAWEEPAFARFVRSLAAYLRVVLFDRRGVGLSDRPHNDVGLDLHHLRDDIEAVLDASDTQQAVMLGYASGGPSVMAFAADRPERVSALVLLGTQARFCRAPGYDIGLTEAELDAFAEALARSWGSGWQAALHAPSLAADRPFRSWFGRLERHSCPPGAVRAAVEALQRYDAISLLDRIAAPCLVMHCEGDQVCDVGHGRYLAAHIPGARYVELPGADHVFFCDPRRRAVVAILSFIDAAAADGRLVSGTARRLTAHRGDGWAGLTDTEFEVAELVSAGLTNQQAASRLAMSRFTVDAHLRRIYKKLRVANRTQLATAVARARSS